MLHLLVDVLIFLRVAVVITQSLYVFMCRGTLVRDTSSIKPFFLRETSSKGNIIHELSFGDTLLWHPKMEANVSFFFWLAVSTVCTYCAAVLNVILMLLGTAPAFLDTVCPTF